MSEADEKELNTKTELLKNRDTPSKTPDKKSKKKKGNKRYIKYDC
jgi:hypothetical protein